MYLKRLIYYKIFSCSIYLTHECLQKVSKLQPQLSRDVMRLKKIDQNRVFHIMS